MNAWELVRCYDKTRLNRGDTFEVPAYAAATDGISAS